MTSKNALKACPNPWCSSINAPLPARSTASETWRIICACGVRTFAAETEEAARHLWNTRSPGWEDISHAEDVRRAASLVLLGWDDESGHPGHVSIGRWWTLGLGVSAWVDKYGRPFSTAPTHWMPLPSPPGEGM